MNVFVLWPACWTERTWRRSVASLPSREKRLQAMSPVRTVTYVSGPDPLKKWSREWELNPRPADYESAALPLSYLGPLNDNSIRGKTLSIHANRQATGRPCDAP